VAEVQVEKGSKVAMGVGGGCLLVGCGGLLLVGLAGGGWLWWTQAEAERVETEFREAEAAALAEVKAMEAAEAAAAEQARAEAETRADSEGGGAARPSNQPCRVVMRTLQGEAVGGWRFRYDDEGRIRAARRDDVEGLSSWHIRYFYDSAGRLLEVREEPIETGGELRLTTLTYDNALRLTSWEGHGERWEVTERSDRVWSATGEVVGVPTQMRLFVGAAGRLAVPRPLVFGPGVVVVGEDKAYRSVEEGEPERLVRTVRYEGADGGISDIETETHRFRFRYDC
jgi:hypothetical protein